MDNNFTLNLPINTVSFGNVSVSILREIHKLGLEPNIFPIGQPDLSAQKIEQDFGNWINSCLTKANKTHKKCFPAFKLWHLNGGHESVSYKQFLYTFWETDSPTSEELNVVKNNEVVGLSSQYAVDILSNFGCDNVIKLRPGFDKYNFGQTNKKYFDDDRIVFSVVGKYEPLRKNHSKLIQTWIKRFGNKKKYWLHCAINNPFVHPDQMKQFYIQLLQGQNIANVIFYPNMQQNEVYNDWLNAAHIVVGMGNESFGLPEFHSIAMGKHAVILNVNGYKEYANKENSVLINPNGKMDAHDGMFFHKGTQWNQGQFFTFDENEFVAGCEEAIKRVESGPVNLAGLKLQEQFKTEDTAKIILDNLEKLT